MLKVVESMKKFIAIFFGFLLITLSVQSEEKLTIEKQLIGILGVTSGTVSNGAKELKTGDKIYLGETILSGENSGAQLLLLDQSTFTIGSDSEVVMDTFIYDPENNDGKIVSTVKKGSLKVISGLISKKNPDNLTVEVPEGTLGSRGTEFQTIVNKKSKTTQTLLIGPGKNNTLGLRPGAVLVSNNYGSTMLNKPYSFTKMRKGSAPDKAKQISKRQLKMFKKQVKALRVARLEGSSKKERKALRKEIRQQLILQGVEPGEIKEFIKIEMQNLKLEIDTPIEISNLPNEEGEITELEIAEPETLEFEIAEPETLELEIVEPEIIQEAPKLEPTPANTNTKESIKKEVTKDKKNKDKKALKKNKKKKKKKGVKKKKKKKKKKGVKKKDKKKKKKAVKKKDKKKKKKAVKKTAKKKKKKAVKKKSKKKKKKAVKKKSKKKKKKVVKKKAKKKKKVVKKKPKKKKKKVVKKKKKKKKKIVKKKVAKKKKKAKKKRRRKK